MSINQETIQTAALVAITAQLVLKRPADRLLDYAKTKLDDFKKRRRVNAFIRNGFAMQATTFKGFNGQHMRLAFANQNSSGFKSLGISHGADAPHNTQLVTTMVATPRDRYELRKMAVHN